MTDSNEDQAQEDAPRRLSGRAVLQAAGIVALAFIVGRFLGLGREIIIRAFFGVGSLEAQAYALANRLPDFIFNVVAGGALASAFVPTFTSIFSRDEEAAAWRLFSAIVSLILLLLAILAALTAWFAEPLLRSLYFSAEMLETQPELLGLTIRLMRVMLISTVIFGASGVLMATLNARQRFLAPALAVSMYNIGIIAGTVLWAPSAMGLAYGAVIGSAAHLAIQLPAFFQVGGRYRPLFDWRIPGVQRVMVLMAPRVLGLSFSYLNRFIMPILTRPLVVGSLPSLDNALQVTLMPYSILGQAMGIAAFPTLAQLAAEERWAEMKRILVTAFRSIVFLGLPITLGMMLLRRPLIILLFQRGEFDAEGTAQVTAALLFYLIALIALAMLEVVSRTFYALEDTVTPVVASLLQLPLMAAFGAFFAYWLFPQLGLRPLGGLALGFSVSNWLEVWVLTYLLRRRIGRINSESWRLWPILAAGGIMAVAVALTAFWFDGRPFWALVVATPVGGLIYAGLALFWRVPEMEQLVGMIRRRLGR